MKDYSDVIEALNEKYLSEFCFEAGLAFVYFDSQWIQAICFCEIRLWTSEDSEFDYYLNDEDGNIILKRLFDLCCDEYENLVEMMSNKIKEK